MAAYRPDPQILTLGGAFYDAVEPADFPKCEARFLNRRWAERVGLGFDDEGWRRHFCRFEPLADVTIPLRISVGAGIFPMDGQTLDGILIAADRRMYEDKTTSRRLAALQHAEAALTPVPAALSENQGRE